MPLYYISPRSLLIFWVTACLDVFYPKYQYLCGYAVCQAPRDTISIHIYWVYHKLMCIYILHLICGLSRALSFVVHIVLYTYTMYFAVYSYKYLLQI